MDNNTNENASEKLHKKQPKMVRTAQEIADELGVSKKTIYAYVNDGVFVKKEYAVVKRGTKRYYTFFADTSERFLARMSGESLPQPDGMPPKRIYNKHVTKGKHKKIRKSA